MKMRQSRWTASGEDEEGRNSSRDDASQLKFGKSGGEGFPDGKPVLRGLERA